MAENGKVQSLITRLGELEKNRQPFELIWQDIWDNLIPRVIQFGKTTAQNKTNPILNKKIFNGEPGTMIDTLVSGLQGNLIPASTPWFSLKVRDKKLGENYRLKLWLKEVETHLYSQLQSSNFYNSVTDLFYGGATHGTPLMTIEDDIQNKRPVFSVRHIKEYYIAEDPMGEVDTVFRRIWMDARNVVKNWEDVPESVTRLAETSPFEKVEIIHAVLPREDIPSGVKGQKGMKWESTYFIPAESHILSEGGFRSFPYIAWRWSKEQEEAYGRSPAMDALVDMIRLNLISKTTLQVANYTANPAVAIPADMANTIGPGGIIPGGRYIVTNPGSIGVQPIPLGQNYPIGVDREERIIETLKKHFKVEFFLMMAASTRQKTATEVIEAQGEKAAAMASITGRIQSEVLDPLFDRLFEIEMEAGRMPPIPPDVAKIIGGQTIEIDYQGPLAMAQRKYHKTQGIMESFAAVMQLASVKPEVLDNIDFDKAALEMMEANGMPPQVIKDLKMVAQERSQRQAMAQAQMQAQMAAQQAATITSNADPNAPIEPNSMLGNMMENITGTPTEAPAGGEQ